MDLPVGTKALILSKWYYGVLSKTLEHLDVDRYYSILYFLNENDGCTQQHICNNLAIDKTAMVKVIDCLIKMGMVQRKINPDDRRQQLIILTKKGIKQTVEVVNAFETLDAEIFSNVATADKDLFIKVLCQLSSNLKELPSNDLFFNYQKTIKTTKKIKSN